MMIVGYQMLKRDVAAVIQMSKGDTKFKMVNTQQFTPQFNIIEHENREISKFLREMENSGKETTRSEALNSLGEELAGEVLNGISRSFSKRNTDGSYSLVESYTKEEVESYGFCTA